MTEKTVGEAMSELAKAIDEHGRDTAVAMQGLIFTIKEAGGKIEKQVEKLAKTMSLIVDRLDTVVDEMTREPGDDEPEQVEEEEAEKEEPIHG